jgi:hypothetical protein
MMDAYDMNNLDEGKFIPCSFDELKEGDIVRSITMTNSQKYFKEGYEDYNMIKTGILIKKNTIFPENSILRMYIEDNQVEEVVLYVDAGTSGYFSLYKYLI